MEQTRQPAFGLAKGRVLAAEQHAGELFGLIDAAIARGAARARARHHRLLGGYVGREIRGLAAADIEPEHLEQAAIRREDAEAEQAHAAQCHHAGDDALAVCDERAHRQQRDQAEHDQHGRAGRVGGALEPKRIRDIDLL